MKKGLLFTMNVNILADFTKNGVDKNEPHIVCGTDDVYLAGQIVKRKLEKEGCVVQSLIVIDGNYTLDQLHDMANYGIGLQKECVRPIYISGDTLRFIQELMNDPQKREELQQELNRRLKSPK